MNRMLLRCAALTALGLTGLATAADVAPGAGQGWTGLTRPSEVITARQELMGHIEELMEPIDTITIKTGPVKEVARLHQSAEVIGAMLGALPHLFPPTTDLYDPKVQEPKTLALPAIWTNFDGFYRLAGAASKAADRMAQAQGDENLRAASRALRSSCDGCHQLFLRKYESPKVLESDRLFDFETALRPRHP